METILLLVNSNKSSVQHCRSQQRWWARAREKERERWVRKRKKNESHRKRCIVSFAYTSVIMALGVEAVKNNYTVQIIWSKVRESYKQGHLWNQNLSWFRIVCVIHCGHIPLAKRVMCAWLSNRMPCVWLLLFGSWIVCERRPNKTRKTKMPCIYSKVPYNYFAVRADSSHHHPTKWVGGRKMLAMEWLIKIAFCLHLVNGKQHIKHCECLLCPCLWTHHKHVNFTRENNGFTLKFNPIYMLPMQKRAEMYETAGSRQQQR